MKSQASNHRKKEQCAIHMHYPGHCIHTMYYLVFVEWSIQASQIKCAKIIFKLHSALPRELRLVPSLYTSRHLAEMFLFN